jgi:DNA-binding FadR family transcriptional regulator
MPAASPPAGPGGTPKPAPRGRNLVEWTASQIGADVIGGKFSPERPLPVEAMIMERFGVSRNVVREAVKTLVGKGLLRTVRRAGTFVEPREKWNLLDADVLAWTMTSHPLKVSLLGQLTQLRVMIEPEVAALAALNATTTEMLRIQQAYEEMELHVRDQQKAIAADILFHQRLFEGAHNDLVRSMMPALVTLLEANFELSIHSANGFIRNLEEHRLVAEAVNARDAEAARRSMRKLLQNNEEDIAAMLEVAARGAAPSGNSQ